MARRRGRRRKERTIEIQATEGGKDPVLLESLLEERTTGGATAPGARRKYKTFGTQVSESYRKYNGEADWGCAQLRAVADIRTSFIAGDGPSISGGSPEFRAWTAAFLRANRILSSRFFDLVLGTELTGRALVFLRRRPGEMPRVIRVPYSTSESWSVVLADKWDPESITGIKIKQNGEERMLDLSDFVFFRVGGDDRDVNKTTTRIGIVLDDFENYDRALKDIRLNNHVAARITPDLEVDNSRQVDEARRGFANLRWKVGKMRIGTGKFSYKTPGTGAAENLRIEMATNLKTISSTTGVPVHWAGWADLMNNRATADSLYDTITNATSRERAIIGDGFRELLVEAQRVYIDSGGTMISRVDESFSVTIPVVDRSRFLELVRGLSIAFGDEAISMADYRSALPGIDPSETEVQVARENATALPSRTEFKAPTVKEEGGDAGD
jgi:hypothetical protein